MINNITRSKIEGDESDEESENNNYEKDENSISHSQKLMNLNQIEDNLSDEGNYTEYIMKGSSLCFQHNYKEALSEFENAKKIAEKIKDKDKVKESLCHIGIAQFMIGNENGLSNLEKLYNEYTQQIKDENFDIGSVHLLLFTKIGSNLFLFYLINSQLNKSREIMDYMLEVIERQKENENKLNTLRNIIFILFRCKSLTLNVNNNYKLLSPQNDEDQIIKKTINYFFQEFNNYLKNNNTEVLINCLSQIEGNLKKIKDYNGLIFIIFAEQALNYPKNVIKLSALIQAINDPKNNKVKIMKNLDNYTNNFNEKLQISLELYKVLSEKEKSIYELIEQDNKSNQKKKDEKMYIFSPKTFNQLFINVLKQTISEIENIENDTVKIQLKTQLDQTIFLLENKKIYFSEKVIQPFKEIVDNTIQKKFQNINNIYNKIQKKSTFQYFKQTLINKKKIENNDKIKTFYENKYASLVDGDVIKKFNMGNNGTKEHFYQINYDKEQIDIFNNKGNPKPDKCIKFKEIKKVTFGMKSQNLISKSKYVPNNKEPWKIMSFILKKKSLDFIFKKEETAKKWFYGIQYLFKSSEKQYKIKSTTGYIIEKLKMKIANETGKNPNNLKKLSFVKTIMTYCKDKNII